MRPLLPRGLTNCYYWLNVVSKGRLASQALRRALRLFCFNLMRRMHACVRFNACSYRMLFGSPKISCNPPYLRRCWE
jgi:hypothetical protein